jgi:hypothetical protein
MRIIKPQEHTEGALVQTQPPADKLNIHVPCDADKSCDYAKYGIATEHGPLYLCGHHYHVNEKYIAKKKYKVEELNA